MALATLELDGLEDAHARFRVDTGTNRYYQLKAGRKARRRHGIDWVDEVEWQSRVSLNESGGDLLGSSTEVAVPLARLPRGTAYVQLFTYKTPDGVSPAFSRVIRVPVGARTSLGGPGPALTMAMSMNTTNGFRPARGVPCRTGKEVYARQASLDQLLEGIVRVAGPIVMQLLSGAQPGAAGAAAPSGGAAPAGTPAQANVLATLLNAVLQGVGGAAAPALATPHSLPTARGNRFVAAGDDQYARPFIAPALLAAAPALAALAGPVLQALPGLLNAANQHRLEMRQANNALVSNILADVNRRLMLERLLQAQPPAPGAPAPNAADMNQLIALLQQATPAADGAAAPAAAAVAAPAAAAPAAAPAAPRATAGAASLNARRNGGYAATLSTRAVVTFETAAPVPWNGKPQVLFARSSGVQLKIRLAVAEPAPTAPLPKAIIKIVWKDTAAGSVLFEKTFKQRDVRANAVIALPFTVEELAHLPVNQPLAVLAEMRWLTPKSGREHKALGALDAVLVTTYWLKQQGATGGAEQELTDMQRFRPFWNKVWEAPSLTTNGNGNGRKKSLWELKVAAKYSVLLAPREDTNGVMETKLLRGPADSDSISERVEGRMKAGVELSMVELNKLLPLWDGAAPLDAGKLEALQTEAFARDNAGEFVYNLHLKGRAADRGMIWVVPVFRLAECTLGRVGRADESGQVVEVADETVRFPLPVAARVIGLKSKS